MTFLTDTAASWQQQQLRLDQLLPQTGAKQPQPVPHPSGPLLPAGLLGPVLLLLLLRGEPEAMAGQEVKQQQ
jgi:hypothetical protein